MPFCVHSVLCVFSHCRALYITSIILCPLCCVGFVFSCRFAPCVAVGGGHNVAAHNNSLEGVQEIMAAEVSELLRVYSTSQYTYVCLCLTK